jgi:aryl-alcohol dehydrogenase-like predicted oxidoreductase
MQYTRLGRTGLTVSRICLGCMSYGSPAWRPWILDEAASRPFFRRAIEAGINFFDTADMYSNGASEEVTGSLLAEMIPKRDDYVLATKLFWPVAPGPNRGGLSRKHVVAACDASLRRLGTDFIDLYQIHRWDFETPIDETMDALDSLVRAGKVRYLGASSMAAWQFSKALYTSDILGLHRFVSMQNHYNLVYREEEREMIPLCLDQGIGLIPWSPLARGFLTGSRTRRDPKTTLRANSDPFADELYFDESDFTVLDEVIDVARARGVKPAQVALAWMLSVPGITAPIIGATREEHIDEAVAAVGMQLSGEEIVRLERAYRPHTIRGHRQPSPRQME